MKDRNPLLLIILAIACIACIFLAWSTHKQLKNKDFEFDKEKALMIKDKLDLKDSLITMRETVNKNSATISTLEEEKISLLNSKKRLEEEKQKTVELFTEQLQTLQQENTLLTEQSEMLKQNPVIKRIAIALQGDKKETVQKALENLLQNLDTIHAGRQVNLAPINITKTSAATPSQQKILPPSSLENLGEILSVDAKHTLIIINLGRRNQIKAGDRCLIVKNGKEIATSEIISVRYRVAAAVIDGINAGYSLTDIKEGGSVLLKD